MMKKTIYLFILASTMLSCRAFNSGEENTSRLHFISSFSVNSVSLKYAREPVFNICTTGDTNQQVEEWAKKATLTWFAAIRVIDDKVTKNIAIDCSNPHLNIQMMSGSAVSYAYAGSAVFYTGKPYGELLHELGHALIGLGDTYQGRQAGACRPDQPQSNMCWGAYGPRSNPDQYSGLWPDDIEGAQNQYRQIFSDLNAPSNAASIDAEKPLVVDEVWSDVDTQNENNNLNTPDQDDIQTFTPDQNNDDLNNSTLPTLATKGLINLSAKINGSNLDLAVSADITENISSALICMGDVTTCYNDLKTGVPTVEFVQMIYLKNINSKSIYKTSLSFKGQSKISFTILLSDNSDVLVNHRYVSIQQK